MDPNAALERALSARQDFMDAVDQHVWPHEGDRERAMEGAGEQMAGAIEDLHEWLCKGGFLPSAWQRGLPSADVQSLVDAADAAASGDSNDDEIDRLQEALSEALTRWPEVTRKGRR